MRRHQSGRCCRRSRRYDRDDRGLLPHRGGGRQGDRQPESRSPLAGRQGVRQAISPWKCSSSTSSQDAVREDHLQNCPDDRYRRGPGCYERLKNPAVLKEIEDAGRWPGPHTGGRRNYRLNPYPLWRSQASSRPVFWSSSFLIFPEGLRGSSDRISTYRGTLR